MTARELMVYQINLNHRLMGLREAVDKLDPAAASQIKLDLVQVEALVELLGEEIKEEL